MIFFFILLVSCIVPGSQGYASDEKGETFEAGGSIWNIQFNTLNDYNSETAGETIDVMSHFGEEGYAQPAWIGNDPGDLGPLWIIQDADGEVMGACWSFYEDSGLECISLYVPATLYIN
jgi:hypothetical protein